MNIDEIDTGIGIFYRNQSCKRGGFNVDLKDLATTASNYVNAHSKEIIDFSDYLGTHPELSGQEYESSKLCAEKLKEHGFDVEYPFLGLDTAFMAKKKSKNASANAPKIAIMVEYDALPEIGHACGHNLHGTMALYAGIALGEMAADLDAEIWVVGTPAEETDGAKVLMAEEGVFDEADFAIMFHSYSGKSFADSRALAIDGYEITFKGQTSHAAATPWLGRSAQSGMLLFIDAINMMRLHVKDMCRVHALITHVSGATNIIPDKAVCRVEVRAPQRPELDELMESVFCCAKGAAIATRTEYEAHKFMRSFDDMLPNLTAEALARDTIEEFGMECISYDTPNGSTDVGNVSYRCPAIQPEFAIVKKHLDLHTREFAEATMSEEGHKSLLKGTEILAAICLKVIKDKDMREKIKKEFAERKASFGA